MASKRTAPSPSPFRAHVDPAAFARLLGSHIEAWMPALSSLAREAGPKALAEAGFGPAALHEAAHHAIASGHADLAHDLAEALSGGGAEIAEALSSAYTRSHADGSFERWWPDEPYSWGEMAKSDRAGADVWIRSGALKLSDDDFWRHYLSDPPSWEDEASARALSAWCSRFSMRSSAIPTPALATSGPKALEAICSGMAGHGRWSSLFDLLRSLRDLSADGGDPEQVRLGARLAAEACASLAKASPGAEILSAASMLSELDPKAGALFAQGLLGSPIDLAELDGSLPQPDDFGQEAPSPLRWTHWTPTADDGWGGRGRELLRIDLDGFPRAELPLGALMSLWSSEAGREAARLAGAQSFPRDMEIIALLRERAKTLPGSPERRAIHESLELRQASADAPFSKKSIRV